MPATSYRSQKHQYRQCERIIAKFTVTTGGVFTRVNGVNQVSNTRVTCGNAASGAFVLNFPKCRLATIVQASFNSGTATAADQRWIVQQGEPNTAAGTCAMALVVGAGTGTNPPAAGGTVTFVMDLAT